MKQKKYSQIFKRLKLTFQNTASLYNNKVRI